MKKAFYSFGYVSVPDCSYSDSDDCIKACLWTAKPGTPTKFKCINIFRIPIIIIYVLGMSSGFIKWAATAGVPNMHDNLWSRTAWVGKSKTNVFICVEIVSSYSNAGCSD